MKNEVFKLINNLGIDIVAKEFSKVVNKQITSEEIAIQFLLEEIEAASKGNDLAQYFALNSGFKKDDYIGAMQNSFKEVDGQNGPQQLLLSITLQLQSDINLMVDLRTRIVDEIMKEWKLGKYASISQKEKLVNLLEKKNYTRDGIFGNINNDLNDFTITSAFTNNMLMKMAYAYARRSVAAGLFLQGVFSRKDYEQASTVFKIYQRQTGQSIEFQQEASAQALELLSSYHSSLNNVIISKIILAVESKQVKSPYEHNIYYQFDDVLNFFEERKDENWIERLWAWADINNIPNLEWIEDKSEVDGGYWYGLPRDKETLLNLRTLGLGDNQLTDLPKEIGNLTKLRSLELYKNQLKELPKEIGNLTNLRVIYLSGNQLKELPKEIGELTNLTALHLEYNELRELPKEIGNLINLNKFDLTSNFFTKLPNEIVNLINLKELSLRGNLKLILSKKQKEWIISLNKDNRIFFDNDLLDRNNYDDIPF